MLPSQNTRPFLLAIDRLIDSLVQFVTNSASLIGAERLIWHHLLLLV
jgi:hypothetical protein